ncbi:hypothetical protein [Sorangium sp. So ce861]|uniref:hypothetical protein n=1 Tax=Sorangium sp. So ce861 TaxID=3133323 RepID=UPI003F6149CD
MKLVLTEVTVARRATEERAESDNVAPAGAMAGPQGAVSSLGGSGCDGGRGGPGGLGGSGGGGRGGHAVGIASAAAPNAAVELKDFKEGAADGGGQVGLGGKTPARPV